MAKLSYQEKLQEAIQHAMAEYISRESNRRSLITVTRVEVSESANDAICYITVLPESAEPVALDFLKRQRTEARTYALKHAKIGRVPFLDFRIDIGEKHRQRLDQISSEISENQQ